MRRISKPNLCLEENEQMPSDENEERVIRGKYLCVICSSFSGSSVRQHPLRSAVERRSDNRDSVPILSVRIRSTTVRGESATTSDRLLSDFAPKRTNERKNDDEERRAFVVSPVRRRFLRGRSANRRPPRRPNGSNRSDRRDTTDPQREF